MRSHLSVITTLWIVIGLVTFPMLYLLVGFANDSPTTETRIISAYLMLFYLQLIIQSFVAAVSLKRINLLRQYLFAILMILLSPLLFLISIPVGMRLSSNQFLLWSSFFILGIQLVGSIWMWVLIGVKAKTTVVSQEGQQVDAITTPEVSVSKDTPSKINTVRTPRRIAHLFLKLPIGIFILIVVSIAVVALIGAIFPSMMLLRSPIFNTIFGGLGGLFALSVFPSLAAGIYLMIRKEK